MRIWEPFVVDRIAVRMLEYVLDWDAGKEMDQLSSTLAGTEPGTLTHPSKCF